MHKILWQEQGKLSIRNNIICSDTCLTKCLFSAKALSFSKIIIGQGLYNLTSVSLEQNQAVKAHVVSGKSPWCPYLQGFKHHGINMLNSHSSNWGPLSEFNTLCTLDCRGWIGKQMLCLYNYKYGECFRDPRTKERLCSEESGNSRVLRSDTMPKIFLISADRSTKYVWRNFW